MANVCIIDNDPIKRVRLRFNMYDQSFIDSHIRKFTNFGEKQFSYTGFVRYFESEVVNKKYFDDIVKGYQKRFEAYDKYNCADIEGDKVIPLSGITEDVKNVIVAQLYMSFPPSLVQIHDDRIILKNPSNLQNKEFEENDNDVTEDFLQQSIEENTNIEPNTIDIHYGRRNNKTEYDKQLSNFSYRPFNYTISGKTQHFSWVEQGYQCLKLWYLYNELLKEIPRNSNENLYKKIEKTYSSIANWAGSAYDAKKTGNTDFKTGQKEVDDLIDQIFIQWDRDKYDYMYNLMLESFKQNEEAQKILLSTGNAKFTHSVGNKEWKEKFPELLTNVRDVLLATSNTNMIVKAKEENPALSDWNVEVVPNLGNKWERWRSQNKDGIIAFRIKDNNDKAFNIDFYAKNGIIGNPFMKWLNGDSNEEKSKLKNDDDIAFLNWILTGENGGNRLATEDLRKVYINLIKQAAKSNAKVAYYTDIPATESHAASIGYLIKHPELLPNTEDKTIFDTLEGKNGKSPLNSGELLTAKEALGTDKVKVVMASEASDPAFHVKKIIDIIKKDKQNPPEKRKYHMVLYMTKHDGLPLRQLLELDITKTIHFSITSLGGTKYEPGVMRMDDLLDRILEFLNEGLLKPHQITIRIDPIIPGVTKEDDVNHIIERATSMGIKQFRFSILDSYGNKENTADDRFVILKMRDLGYKWENYYNIKSDGKVVFSAKQEVFDKWYKFINETAGKHKIKIATCGEMPSTAKNNVYNNITFAEGCLSVKKVQDALGVKEIANKDNGDGKRPGCPCMDGKENILSYDDSCYSCCAYCYAKHNSDSALKYYDKDGNLLQNKYTATKYVNNSGGAELSDYEWGNIGAQYDINTKHWFHDSKTPYGNALQSDEDFKEGVKEAKKASESMGRTWNDKYANLLGRNWNQVKYSDSIFAIGHIVYPGEKYNGFVAKTMQVGGGTGYAVQMAINHNKPVYVFDQERNSWFVYSHKKNDFVLVNTPKLTPRFAGIGTHTKLKDNGIQAIKDVYEKTFGKRMVDIEEYDGKWTRGTVARENDKVFLFGDNIEDAKSGYQPKETQAVIRGLDNAIGIPTKKNRGTSDDSYFTDNDFELFKQYLNEAIYKALASGKTIVLPKDGIGTGAAQLQTRAPKLYRYLQNRLNKLKNIKTTDVPLSSYEQANSMFALPQELKQKTPMELVIEHMRKKFKLKIYTDKTKFDNLKKGKKNKLTDLATTRGHVYGAVDENNNVFIDLESMEDANGVLRNTPIHEFTHIWDRLVEAQNPNLWAKGVELMKSYVNKDGENIWNSVENDENYGKKWAKDKNKTPQQIEFLIASEVHAKLVADKDLMNAAKQLESNDKNETFISKLFRTVAQWMNDFWKALKGTFDLWTKEDLDNLTIDQFINLTLRDFVVGDSKIGKMIVTNKNNILLKRKEKVSQELAIKWLQKMMIVNPESIQFDEKVNGIVRNAEGGVTIGNIDLNKPLSNYIKDKSILDLFKNFLLNIDDRVGFGMSLQQAYNEYVKTFSSYKNEAIDSFYHKITDFINNTTLTKVEIDEVTSYISHLFSDYLYMIKNDEATRVSLGLDNNIAKLSYVEIINKIGLKKFARMLSGDLYENIDNENKRNEIRNNFSTALFYLSLKKIQRSLHIDITPKFDDDINNIMTKNQTQNTSADNTELQIDEDEEEALEHYLVKDSFTMDVYDSISQEMKSYLNSLKVIERNDEGRFETKKTGLGLIEYLEGNQAFEIISKMLSGCRTIDDMIDTLRENIKYYPWLYYIVNDNNINLPLFGNESKILDDNFKELFFHAFSTHTYLFTSQYTNEDGSIISYTNNKSKIDLLSSVTLQRYIHKGGFTNVFDTTDVTENGEYIIGNDSNFAAFVNYYDNLFKQGIINDKYNDLLYLYYFAYIEEDEKTIRAAAKQLKSLKLINSNRIYIQQKGDIEKIKEKLKEAYDQAFNIFKDLFINTMSNFFKNIGIYIDERQLFDILTNNISNESSIIYNKLKKKNNDLSSMQSIRDEQYNIDIKNKNNLFRKFNNNISLLFYSLYKYDSNTKLYITCLTNKKNETSSSFEKQASTFLKYVNDLSDNYSLVFWQNRHLRYAQQLPSFLTNLVDDLRGKGQNAEKYNEHLNKLYGDDEYFKTATGSWRNPLLEMLTDNVNGFEKRDLIKHFTFGDRDGKSYKELEFDFLPSFVTQFFNSGGNAEAALYKVSIMSDKPVMEFIRLPRISGRIGIESLLLNITSVNEETGEQKTNSEDFLSLFKNANLFISKGKNNVNKLLSKYGVLNIYEDLISDLLYSVFTQEIVQIQRALQRAARKDFDTIKKENYDVKELGKSIEETISKNIGTAASFSYLSFFNDLFTNYKLTEDEKLIKQTIVDSINGNQIPKEAQLLITNYIKTNVNTLCDNFIKYCESQGYLKIQHSGPLAGWTAFGNLKYFGRDSDKKFSEFGGELIKPADQKNFDENKALVELEAKYALREYFWNNFINQINISQLTTVTPAFYKDLIAVQKRASQFHAYGEQMNKDAVWNGERVSDGFYRTLIIKDENVRSESYEEFKAYFNNIVESAKDEKTKAELREEFKFILSQLSEDICATDGSALTSPTAIRKKLIMLGQWSDEKERIYNEIASGNFNAKGAEYLCQVLKPLVFGMHHHDGMITPYQFKNSEYCLLLSKTIMSQRNPNKPTLNLNEVLYEVMEDSLLSGRNSKRNANGRYTSNGTANKQGIDTINFESSSKVCNSNVIDFSIEAVLKYAKEHNIKDLKEAGIKYLKSFIYKNGIDGDYNEDYVRVLDYDSYKLLQKTPPHFQDHHQAEGSQNRVLAISDIDRGAEVDYNGKKVNAGTLIDRYNEINKKIFDRLAQEFMQHYNLSNLIQTKKIISQKLKDMIMKDSKVNFDLLSAVEIDPQTGDFVGNINDPLVVRRYAATLLALLKNDIAKAEYTGGPIVQISSFGLPNRPKVVFLKENGEVAEKPEEAVRFGWYECYITCPSEEFEKAITKSDGSLMTIDEIKAKGIADDEVLKLLATRIPSESKYSTLPCKIKGFLPNTVGEHIICPPELVLFTGSDFDIDKLYCQMHDLIREKQSDGSYRFVINRKKDTFGAWMNEIMDIRYALYTAPAVAHISFRPGNFNTLKLYNRAVTIAETNPDIYKITRDGVINKNTGNKASLSELDEKVKSLQSKLKSKFLTDESQDYYYGLNMTDTISIFAKAVSAHAIISQCEHRQVCLPVDFKFGDLKYTNDTSNGKLIGKINKKNADGTYTYQQALTLDSTYNMYGQLISKIISEGVGASADKAKDPVLARLNLNSKTINIFIAMVRLGFHEADIVKFLSSPVVKRISKIYTGNIETDEKALKEESSKFEINTCTELNLDDNYLESILNLYKTSRTNFGPAYYFYAMMNEFSRVMTSIDNFTTLNSYDKASGKTIQENNEKQYIVDQLNKAVQTGYLTSEFVSDLTKNTIPGYIYNAIYGDLTSDLQSISSQLLSIFAEKDESIAKIQYLCKNMKYDYDIFSSVYSDMIIDTIKLYIFDNFFTKEQIQTYQNMSCQDIVKKFKLKFYEYRNEADNAFDNELWKSIKINTVEKSYTDEMGQRKTVSSTSHFELAIPQEINELMQEKISQIIIELIDKAKNNDVDNYFSEKLLMLYVIIMDNFDNYGLSYSSKSILQLFSNSLKVSPDFVFDKINKITDDKDQFVEDFGNYFQLNIIKRCNTIGLKASEYDKVNWARKIPKSSQSKQAWKLSNFREGNWNINNSSEDYYNMIHAKDAPLVLYDADNNFFVLTNIDYDSNIAYYSDIDSDSLSSGFSIVNNENNIVGKSSSDVVDDIEESNESNNHNGIEQQQYENINDSSLKEEIDNILKSLNLCI